MYNGIIDCCKCVSVFEPQELERMVGNVSVF